MNQTRSFPEATFLVFAMSPCSVLDKAIRRAKSKTRSIAGEQTYLSHPPHLTLYVSAFASDVQTFEHCTRMVSKWRQPKIRIRGWHVFDGDVLTGDQTLVCEIADECLKELRDYQLELIREISGHRCVEMSSNRYRPHFGTFAPARKLAVEKYGYPFVGDDWIPHLTIASIASSQWKSVWQSLEPDPPIGDYACPKLTLYTLNEDEPEYYREIEIVN